MKPILKSLLPDGMIKSLREWRDTVHDRFMQPSWSQEGEDLLLKRMFDGRTSGFYVDVGAHHPRRFSNTWLFYNCGWRGINIDAMPGSMTLFRRLRPRDINLEIAVAEIEQQLTYYIFNEPALNGLSAGLSANRDSMKDYRIIDTKPLLARPLKKILAEYLPKGQMIDFLSVDVEGLDFAVLRSNDWQRFRPEVLLVEVLGSTLEDIVSSELTMYMQTQGYFAFAKLLNTVFFLRNACHNLSTSAV
jgi:hypothetical protein